MKLSAPLTAVAQARADEVSAGRGGQQPATEEDMRRAAKVDTKRASSRKWRRWRTAIVETVVAAWQEEGGRDRSRARLAPNTVDVGLARRAIQRRAALRLLFAFSWNDFFREKTGPLADLERVRREMLERVNRERAARTPSPMRRHPRLTRRRRAMPATCSSAATTATTRPKAKP